MSGRKRSRGERRRKKCTAVLLRRQRRKRKSRKLRMSGKRSFKMEDLRLKMEAMKKRVQKGHTQNLINCCSWPESANAWETFANVGACILVVNANEHRLQSGKQRSSQKRRCNLGASTKAEKRRCSAAASDEGAARKVKFVIPCDTDEDDNDDTEGQKQRLQLGKQRSSKKRRCNFGASTSKAEKQCCDAAATDDGTVRKVKFVIPCDTDEDDIPKQRLQLGKQRSSQKRRHNSGAYTKAEKRRCNAAATDEGAARKVKFVILSDTDEDDNDDTEGTNIIGVDTHIGWINNSGEAVQHNEIADRPHVEGRKKQNERNRKHNAAIDDGAARKIKFVIPCDTDEDDIDGTEGPNSNGVITVMGTSNNSGKAVQHNENAGPPQVGGGKKRNERNIKHDAATNELNRQNSDINMKGWGTPEVNGHSKKGEKLVQNCTRPRSRLRKPTAVKYFMPFRTEKSSCLTNSATRNLLGSVTRSRFVAGRRRGSNPPYKEINPCPNNESIVEIIRPINFVASVPGREITVNFIAKRSDGKEVVVDNKYLTVKNPVMLISFYERHLKYNADTEALK